VNSGPAVRETFSRDDRLRKRRGFEECYASGIRASGRHLQVFLLPEAAGMRLGLSVPRRVGTATVRNRVKRRLRETFRRNRSAFAGKSFRLVVNARASAGTASFSELTSDFMEAVGRALSRVKPRP
jgi:ribonuclease P protein component